MDFDFKDELNIHLAHSQMERMKADKEEWLNDHKNDKLIEEKLTYVIHSEKFNSFINKIKKYKADTLCNYYYQILHKDFYIFIVSSSCSHVYHFLFKSVKKSEELEKVKKILNKIQDKSLKKLTRNLYYFNDDTKTYYEAMYQHKFNRKDKEVMDTYQFINFKKLISSFGTSDKVLLAYSMRKAPNTSNYVANKLADKTGGDLFVLALAEEFLEKGNWRNPSYINEALNVFLNHKSKVMLIYMDGAEDFFTIGSDFNKVLIKFIEDNQQKLIKGKKKIIINALLKESDPKTNLNDFDFSFDLNSVIV